MNRKKPLAVAAIRRLGLGIEELLRRSFTHEASKGAGNGMIPFDYYQMFWFQIGSPGGTTEFMPLILNRLIAELERKAAGPVKGKDKAQEDNKDAAEVALSPVLLQGLVNTIMFTTLYLKCNPKDSRILKPLERWAELDKSKKISGILPSAAEAMRILGVMKDEAAALNTIVISCSTLRTAKEFQELEKRACLDDGNVPDADSCFFFSFLRAAIVDDASRMAILKATSSMLNVPAQMKTQALVAETTLLALLFMLKQFIASGPVTDTQFLRKALTTLRQFYLWPKPFGTYTREILQIVKDELICPGSLLRTQFDTEAKFAHYKPVRKNAEYGRAVYYFWEADHPESKTRAAVMELRPRKPNEKKRRGSRVGNLDLSSAPKLSGATQALLMLNLMAEEKEVGATAEDLELFSKLSETQIGTLYSKFQEVLNTLRSSGIDKAGPVRVAELKKIKAEVAALAAKGTADATVIPKVPSPFLPELPTLVHTSVEITPSSYHQESKDQLGLMCLEYIPYPTTNYFEEQLDTIFANYATVPKPITVRLVIAGGNRLLHSFLCSYMRMEQIHMEWIKGINIQLFVVPWSSNDLSNFIARHDSWYNRHIYVPFRTPLPVLPFSDPSDDKMTLFEPDDTEDAPPVEKPGLFLREIMASYIRGAQQTLPVNVYLLEGWLDPLPVKSDKDKTEKKQKDKKIDLMADSIVPFIGRVLLGEEADKQQAEKKTKNTKFTYNPEDLVVRFSRMDLAGNTFATQTEDPFPYQAITIANLPVPDDVCYAADPSVPWLEMHALVSKKADATKVGGRNLLLTDPRQHVDCVEVSCTGPSQSFSCLVDGVLFGPFHHIKVSRCRKPKSPETGGDKGTEQELGDPYVLPISTFFPINV